MNVNFILHKRLPIATFEIIHDIELCRFEAAGNIDEAHWVRNHWLDFSFVADFIKSRSLNVYFIGHIRTWDDLIEIIHSLVRFDIQFTYFAYKITISNPINSFLRYF